MKYITLPVDGIHRKICIGDRVNYLDQRPESGGSKKKSNEEVGGLVIEIIYENSFTASSSDYNEEGSGMYILSDSSEIDGIHSESLSSQSPAIGKLGIGQIVLKITKADVDFHHILLSKSQIGIQMSHRAFNFCSLSDCSMIRRRRDLLCVCKKMNHFSCCSHLVPWDFYAHNIDDKKLYRLKEKFNYILRNNFSQHPTIDTILLLQHRALENTDNQQKADEKIREQLACNNIACEACFFMNEGDGSCSLEDIHNQLFPINNKIQYNNDLGPSQQSPHRPLLRPDTLNSNPIKSPTISGPINNLPKIIRDQLLVTFDENKVNLVLNGLEMPPEELAALSFEILFSIIEETQEIPRQTVSHNFNGYENESNFNKNTRNMNQNNMNDMAYRPISTENRNNTYAQKAEPVLATDIRILVRYFDSDLHRTQGVAVLLPKGYNYPSTIELIASRIGSPDASLSLFCIDDRFTESRPSGAEGLKHSSTNSMYLSQERVGDGYWEDEDQICLVEIRADTPDDAEGKRRKATVADFVTNDIVFVRPVKDGVALRPRTTLSLLADEFKFNASMQDKIRDLARVYSSWRSVRGDGNCYYRAVIFSVLEQIIQSKRRHCFKRLKEIFSTVSDDIYGEVAKEAHSSFLSKLTDAAEDRVWHGVLDLETSFLLDHQFDLASIRACRRLISSYLLTHQFDDANGMCLRDAILVSYDPSDVSGLNQYCHKYVNTMGVDAEGPIVYLGILLIALECDGCTVLLDRREDVSLTVTKTIYVRQTKDETPNDFLKNKTEELINGNSKTSELSKDSNDLIASVHLLLRPGHYDVLNSKPNLTVDEICQLYEFPGKIKLAEVEVQQKAQALDEKKISKDLITSHSAKRRVVFCYYPLVRETGVHVLNKNIGKSNGGVGDDDGRLNGKAIAPMSIYLSGELDEVDMIKSCKEHFHFPSNYDIFMMPIEKTDQEKFRDYFTYSDDEDHLIVELEELKRITVEISHVDGVISSSTLLIDRKRLQNNLANFKTILSNMFSIHIGNMELNSVNDLQEDSIIHIQTYITLIFKKQPNDPVGISARFDYKADYSALSLLAQTTLQISSSHMSLWSNYFDSHVELNDLNFKDVLQDQTVIWVKCCESSTCDHTDREFIILTNCKHCICHNCLCKVLTSGPPDSVTGHKRSYPFHPPDSVDAEAKLDTYTCPVNGCSDTIQDSDSTQLIQYFAWLNEFEKDIKTLQSYQICALSEPVCGEGKQPIENLIQLDCGHFFHQACLGPYIRNKLTECRQKKMPVLCPACEQSNNECSCPVCADSGRRGCHIIWESELKARLGTELEQKDYDFVEKLSVYVSNASSGTTLFECKCGIFYICREGERLSNCECGYVACLLCQTEMHKDMTCQEAQESRQRRAAMEMALESGSILQICPRCSFPWGVPVECQHATCEKGIGGCGAEFCYLCGVYRSPTLEHGNSYHRPLCEFYAECCNKKCVENGSATCEELRQSDRCEHCRAARSLCIPPGNPTEEMQQKGTKILKKADVEAEAARINHQDAKADRKR